MHARNSQSISRRVFAYLVRQAPLLIFLSLAVARPASANVRLTIDPLSIDFGNVALGNSLDRTIHITNPSTADIEIDNLVIGGGAATDYSVISPLLSSLPIVVPAGTTTGITVIVRFDPRLLGLRPGSLTIETSDGSADVELKGTGTGDQSAISFNLKSIDFGRIAPNATRDTVIWLHSDGSGSATITGLQVTNGSGDLDFEAALQNSSLTFPIDLGPGDSLPIVVTFSGLLPEGVKLGQLGVLGDALNAPTCDLSGEVIWGAAKLSVPEIDFGQMYVGEVRDTFLDIVNTGDVDISLVDLSLNSLDFFLNPAPALPLVVKAGSTYRLGLRAAPPVPGPAFSQIQTVSRTTIPSFMSANLKADVLAMPLTLSGVDTLHASCAGSAPISYTRTVSNSGPRPFPLTAVVVEEAGVTVTLPAMPVSVPATGSLTLNFSVDASTIPVKGYYIVDYMNSDVLLFRDTVFVSYSARQAASAVAASRLNSLHSEYIVRSADDLSATPISTLIVHLTSSDPNVIAVEGSTVALASTLSGASLTTVAEANGYKATISSPTPIALNAAGDILTFKTSEFISTSDSATITASLEAPEWAGCLSFANATTVTHTTTGCGTDALREYLKTGSIALNGVERIGHALVMDISSSANLSATLTIVSPNGATLGSPVSVGLQKGRTLSRIDISSLPVGAYFGQLRTSEGSVLSFGFTK
jgi:hypothetical protein